MKRLFLIDALGAVATAMMLGLVLTQFESAFGMPRRVLVPLALVAVGFAAYSLSCFVRASGPAFLLGIATANTLYCVVTLSLVIYLRASLTWLGVAYFLGEIVIVMALVTVEVRAARQAAS